MSEKSQDQQAKQLAREKLAMLASPVRLAIGTSLALRPATAAEVAKELELPVEKVRYQIKRLMQRGLVDIEEQIRRRGVLERVYSVDSRKHVLERDELADLPEGRRIEAEARLLRMMFHEALEALRSGTFATRDDHASVRVPLHLDNRGWADVAEIHRQLVGGVLDARVRSMERVEESGEEPTAASIFLLFFEARDPLA